MVQLFKYDSRSHLAGTRYNWSLFYTTLYHRLAELLSRHDLVTTATLLHGFAAHFHYPCCDLQQCASGEVAPSLLDTLMFPQNWALQVALGTEFNAAPLGHQNCYCVTCLRCTGIISDALNSYLSLLQTSIGTCPTCRTVSANKLILQ